MDRLTAEREELEEIQQEIEEAERHQSRQPPQANAADITNLMIGRMAKMAAELQIEEADQELIESLTRSLRNFFDQTSSSDAEYLTRTATEYVTQIRNADSQRIRRGQPDLRAAMATIKHAGKFINCLPSAIQQVLQHVRFNSGAPSREPPEDQAEYEEDVPLEEEPQGVPSAAWNPREVSSTSRTGRVQEAVQRIEAPQTSNVPAPKWHGWKTQTGPTIADMEQSRMSPFGDPESEMPDPDLREAMIRSLQEMTRST